MYIRHLASDSIKWILWNLSMHLTILFSIDVPIVDDIFSSITSKDVFLALVTSVYFTGRGKLFFFQHVQFDSGFNVITVNKLPEMDQKSFLAYHHATTSLEVGLKKIRLILLEDYLGSTSRSGRSRVKVDVLRTCSPPESFNFPSAIGNINFSPLMGFNTSFALSLLAWSSDASICCDHNVSFPDSPLHTMHNRWKNLARLLDQIDVVSTGLSQR